MTALLPVFGLVLALAAAAYALVVLAAVLLVPARLQRLRWPANPAPATVLKPLSGAEPRLYENLRSFCTQQHPAFQLVFGVAEASDPALAVARRLQSEFPALPITLVANAASHGGNRKVSNLINLLPWAQHELLVIADSDIAVPPDWLARVTAPLADAGVGLVTCPYLGKPLPGFWAWFGAQFINDWFAPNVLLTRLFGDSPCAFGSTLALRRSALAEAGGLEGIKDAIADDYRLAESLRRLGLRTVLSECFVSTDVTEASARQLASRELRWLRLSFNVQPLGFAFALPSFALLTGLAGALLASQPAGWLLLAITLLTRLAIQKAMRRLQPAATPRGAIAAALLMPLREAFSAALWASAFVRRRVRWQGKDFCYAANGAIQTPHHPDQPRHAENPVPAPPVV